MTPLRARWFVPLTCAVLGLIGACTLTRTIDDALPREMLAMIGCAVVALVTLVRRTRKRWPAAFALIALAPMIKFDPDLEVGAGGIPGAMLILGLFGCFVSTLWIFLNEDTVEPRIATAKVR